MFQNLIQEFAQTSHNLKPQHFDRCGFEARSYFNFGEHCDPRHQLPISIVIWRLPPTEQLKQSQHPQTDIVTYVMKGGYRLDNSIQENQQFKEGDVIQYICGNDNSYHRDSNSSEEVTEIIQLFIQNIYEQRNTEQRLYKQDQVIKNEKYYEIDIQKGNDEINNKDYNYLIIINLDEKFLIIDEITKLNKYECQYYTGEQTCKVQGNLYLTIKLL